MDKPVIQLQNVRKIYRTDAGEFEALRGITLDVYKSEFIAVIGKSGSGKSTLVNMITGIDKPTTGEISIDGVDIHHLSENEMAKMRGEKIGIVFQFFQLLPTLTVIENIMLPMDIAKKHTRIERRERAMELLELVDLADNANKLPSAISGGQQQRAAIARALSNNPPVIVADEPTGNLDSKTANTIFELFHTLVERDQKTILMVTHDDDQAKKVKRVIRVHDGAIV